MDLRLNRLSRRQGGAFTVAQAMACGYSRGAIRHRLTTRSWASPRYGVLCESQPPHGSLERAVLDAWVAVLAHRDAVVGYGAAATLHGLPTYRPTPGIELVRAKKVGRTPSADLVTVTTASLPDDHIGEPHGVPSTSLARTACDLARRGSLRDGVVVLDGALRLGCSRALVDAVIEICRGWPGARGLRAAWSVADVGSESPLESLAHVLHHEHGIPRAQTQVQLYDARGFIGRVDDYWSQFATVGESDGLGKYDEPGALRTEKLRQERLEQAGLQVVRVTYADVTRDETVTARRYREAFERGQQRLSWRPSSVRAVASPARWRLDAG